jgi:hypothetical protein
VHICVQETPVVALTALPYVCCMCALQAFTSCLLVLVLKLRCLGAVQPAHVDCQREAAKGCSGMC